MVERNVLVRGGLEAFRLLIRNFLKTYRFNTPYGITQINKLLITNGITYDEKSIKQYLYKSRRKLIGFIVFEDNAKNDYLFVLINVNSQEELKYIIQHTEQLDRLSPLIKLEIEENAKTI
jgi:hypothetical protein